MRDRVEAVGGRLKAALVDHAFVLDVRMPGERGGDRGRGGVGALLKDVPATRLVEAVRLVAEGSMLLGPSMTRRLVEEFARPEPDGGVGDGVAASRP